MAHILLRCKKTQNVHFKYDYVYKVPDTTTIKYYVETLVWLQRYILCDVSLIQKICTNCFLRVALTFFPIIFIEIYLTYNII